MPLAKRWGVLVSDDLRDPRRADRLDLLGGRDERVDQGRRVARTRVPHRHAHDGACVQVDRMLGGVRQMRAAVRHSRDRRVRIVRVGPVVVRALLRAGSGRTGPTPRASASRGRTPRPAGSETRRSSHPYPAAQCSASPHWLPASWHRSPPCAPRPAWRRPVAATPTYTPPGGSRGQSGDGCATASSGPAAPRAPRSPRTRGCSANRRRATRLPVPSPTLRSSRAAAADKSGPAPDSAGRPRPRRTTRTVLPRTHRTPPRRAPDSVAHKTGAQRSSADPPWAPTWSLAAFGRVVSPSPCPTV